MCSKARCLVRRSSPAPARATAKKSAECFSTLRLYKKAVLLSGFGNGRGGFPPGEAGASGALDAFFLLLAADAEAGVGDGAEALLRDLLAAGFAQTEAAVLDALEGFLDFVDLVALVLHEPEGDVLLVAVRAEVGQVHGKSGEVARRVGALLAGFVL